ncbi:Fur family transcriptional regulator [Roseicyclus persicicus]|uniref:Transcriptional repressor n=1 Tax=Roseicyclus persicicus TaxID=2650661 RepID=A0A7X6JW46_9RHOB|nr:transcriptional repressor [Roseibacterium persicicum]NKX43962.1 transcriptional repressor [Roseibacterium persicicum]
MTDHPAPPPPETIGFQRHDHSACIAGTVAAVAARCAEEGLQLTPVRRRVLEILLQRHRAIGAYEILDTLREEGLGSQPPVAYRALEFLTKHGFAHRIEGLNAFAACTHPGHDHDAAFLICSGCGAVAEAPVEPARAALQETAEAAGFTIRRTVLEAEGLCPNCTADAAR